MSTDQRCLDRTRLRNLQDRFLNLPTVLFQVNRFGWDRPICGPGSPTYRQVEQTVYPAWENFFRGFLSEN